MLTACEFVKRGSPCDIRPVCSLRDKQWNSSVNQEVGCCKGCSWETWKRKGNCSMLSQSPQQLHRHKISLTPSVLLHWGWCRYLASSSSSPKDCVYQTITGMLNQAPGAHTHSNTQQHSAPVSDCQHRERDTVNHTGQHSEGERAEKSGRQTTIILSAKKKTYCAGCTLCATHHMMVKAMHLFM